MFEQKHSGQALLLFLFVLASSMAAAIEKPEYEIVAQIDDVEFRRYAPFVIAETEIVGEEDWNDAANEGFRRLFDYITGSNGSAEKIAMTAPVQQSEINRRDVRIDRAEALEGESGWKIAFMLPSSYTLAGAPEPQDERIKIRVVPERVVAALRYSGRWTERNFEKHAARLLDAIALANIEPLGAPESAVYNPPFMPPFLRRNEVLVEVVSLPR